MSNTDEIQDEIVQHQAYIIKVGEGQANKANDTIRESEEELVAAIALALLSITSAPTKANQAKLIALENRLKRIRSKVFEQAELDNQEDMSLLAENESRWMVKTLLAILAVRIAMISDDQRDRITTLIPFAGRTPSQWWASALASDVSRIMTTIRAGVQNALSNSEIVNAVRGTRAIAGVLETTRNDVRALARTIATGVSNESQDATVKKTSVLNRVMWVSILDSRTSTICRGLSGTIWGIMEPHPTPPAHPSCRSTLTYLVEGEAPPEEPTYDQWIRRRTRDAQEDILPKWQLKELDKGVPLSAFVTKDIEPMTMKEYMAKFGG